MLRLLLLATVLGAAVSSPSALSPAIEPAAASTASAASVAASLATPSAAPLPATLATLSTPAPFAAPRNTLLCSAAKKISYCRCSDAKCNKGVLDCKPSTGAGCCWFYITGTLSTALKGVCSTMPPGENVRELYSQPAVNCAGSCATGVDGCQTCGVKTYHYGASTNPSSNEYVCTQCQKHFLPLNQTGHCCSSPDPAPCDQTFGNVTFK